MGEQNSQAVSAAVSGASDQASGARLQLDDTVVQDPILDLCPSLEILQQLSRSARFSRQVKQDKLGRALLRASSNGDTDMLSWLLDHNAEARKFLADEVAPAATGSSRQSLRIEFGRFRDEEGSGPVVLAACAGHIDAVAMLIVHGADVDERDASGWTPLMWATNSSNLPLVSFLLSRGADVEAKSNKGTTCEDFILSAAPEAAMSREASTDSQAPEGSRVAPLHKVATTDQEAIADLIYEHHRYLSVQQSAAQRLHNLNLGSPSKSSQAAHQLVDMASSSSPPPGARPGSAASGSPFKRGHARTSSQLTARRLVGRYERAHLAEQQSRRKELNQTRKGALADIATLLEVDYGTLVGDLVLDSGSDSLSSSSTRPSMIARRRRAPPKVVHADLASGCGAAEVGSDLLSVEFNWKTVQSDQMLVLGPADLNPLLDMMITNCKPVRAPWTSRAAPANVLFLCARYACRSDDQELLEELFLGAIDRIESIIYSHPTEMTYMAFWLYNCCLLRYYVEKDHTMRKLPAVAEHRALLSDLLNEIYVFIIRDAERRIDKVLDAAMLDHEAIPGLDEIRFEGEWKFMKTLAGSVRGIGQQGSISSTISSKSNARKPISQIFGGGGVPGADSASDRIDSSSLAAPSTNPSIGNGRPHGSYGSSSFGPSSRRTNGADGSSPSRLTEAFSSLREVSYNVSASDLLSKPTPRTITSLLTSTLQVLQFYEINPAIIVQGLSQVFFWVGCELFNRVLMRKRYLCRSRAIQVRMNVSVLEDWARSNALPLSIVHSHLSPLSQLISWLQCQSSLQEFDGLIATMQGLKALTPVQLRKAVKDYRYEVSEPRMSEECLQYLDQLIIDWKRRQEDQLRQVREEAYAVHQKKKKFKKAASAHSRSGTATQRGYDDGSHTADIDANRSSSSSDEEDDKDDVFRADDMDVDGLGRSDPTSNDTSLNSVASGDTAKVKLGLSKAAEEPLTVAERVARAAQDTIDGLFQPGKSMADYVPPWTASGAPMGLHEGGGSTSAPPTPSKHEELLNSREMLPFALPRKRSALIVTPGDAFGFGRGHFTGTGSPSVRSVNGDASEASSSAASSRRSSIGGASRPGSPTSASQGARSSQSAFRDAGDVQSATNSDGDNDSASVSGASSLTDASGVSRASSLFPQGKGFAAGGYWSPVPLLADGMLEKVDQLMRNVAILTPSDRASRNILQAEKVTTPVSPNFPIPIPLRDSSSSTAVNDLGQTGPEEDQSQPSMFLAARQIDTRIGQGLRREDEEAGGEPTKYRASLPPSSRIVIPPRDRSMIAPHGSSSPSKWSRLDETDSSAVDEFGRFRSQVGGEDDDGVTTPGPYRQNTLRASTFNFPPASQ
ncbi:hypothetical protein BCV70DRAFT_196909 [Testicularia cyperi]|uniref:Dilute domain-containing protein n=1 Tax=Testicularia cyperi TaxID=1882483 RepID=A0A317XWI2_9BASI|nr:hypothetical protein BCV70DRAFT_196909 [Testicularia cyperi]